MSKQLTPLQKFYNETVAPALVASRGYKNKHQVPKLTKIVLNTGIGAEADKNQIADTARDMGLIAGQKPVLNRTKRAIANFKLKPNQVTGCHVTLRGESMWHFLMRLLAVALPTIRDFRGVPNKLDGQGNYALVIELDPATRDRYRPVDNQISKEGQRIVDTLADGIARFATYSPTIPGVHTVYSDSVVFEQAHAGQGGLP